MSVSNPEYRVQVKRGNRWTEYDTARFHISVGQEYHEGEKLRATFLWARTRPSIKRVIVCVNDTLQRYNSEMLGDHPSLAFELSQAAGSAWIERNRETIRMLPNHEIVRWEQWKEDNRFPSVLAETEQLYDQSPEFKKDIDQEINSFWHRAQKRGETNIDFERFRKFSSLYLLEECAVFKLMFERDQAVDIYPGSTLLPCKLGANSNLGEKRFTRIGFQRVSDGVNNQDHAHHAHL